MLVNKVLGIVLMFLASLNCEYAAMKKSPRGTKLVLGARSFLEEDPLPPQTSLFDLTECKPDTCDSCTKKIGKLLLKIKGKEDQPNELRRIAYEQCKSFKISLSACRSYIDLNFNIFLYILKHKKEPTPEDFCGVVYESCGCKKSNTTSNLMTSFYFGIKPFRKLHKRPKSRKLFHRPMTVIQITDIHYDPEYKEFSNTECYEPMCCRSDHGIPKDNKTAAGYWGDYRKCDLPWRTLLNALDQIKKHHKHIDLIYMTGDIVAHSIWETTIEKNTYAIKKVLRKIKEVFPNVPVFPILGNHEPSPLNVYTPPDVDDSISTRWLYELVADEWSVWLPPETRETILQGGYYSVLVKPGFRIVGINSNLCYTLNWFIAIDDNTQFLLDHLNWLAQTLYEAELAREKVHILSHVPINDMCLYEWGKEYKRIIDRFQSTVIAQFVGHTHWDEFELYYSLDDPTKPINVAFNGGSLTHYDNLNSNYKVYKVHPETYDIIDGETWIFNLTEANESPYENIKPHWFKLYSYKEAFNMESLYPEDFDKLAYRMASDKALLQKYAWYFVKAADSALPCDDECLQDKLCRITTAQTQGNSYCYKSMNNFRHRRAQYEYPTMPGVKYNNLSMPVYSNTSRCDCP